MKRFGDLFDSIVNYENLELAHQKARKGKTTYREVVRVDNNTKELLIALQETLISGGYRTSPYVIQEKWEGKKLRNIYKLPYYPDRIVHHAIMNITGERWIKSLIRDTYQSIPGRGVHLMANRLKSALRTDSFGTKYCLKMDIRKFYPSVNNNTMKNIIRDKIKDRKLLNLLDEIVDSTIGLPIGNYLSQIFGNLYLSNLDHWLKETKKVKYYFRYCDDLIVLGEDSVQLHELRLEISNYLKSKLQLELKKDWQVFPVEGRGIDVIGFCFFPTHTLLRKSIAKAFIRKVKAIERGWDTMEPSKMVNGLMSYGGWLQYADCYRLHNTYFTPGVKARMDIAKNYGKFSNNL